MELWQLPLVKLAIFRRKLREISTKVTHFSEICNTFGLVCLGDEQMESKIVRMEVKYKMEETRWKDIKCKKEGVLLIRIPHFVAYEDLSRYITNKLDKKQLLPRNNRSKSTYGNSSYQKPINGLSRGIYD